MASNEVDMDMKEADGKKEDAPAEATAQGTKEVLPPPPPGKERVSDRALGCGLLGGGCRA